jgi:hypothetical protein
VPDRRECLCEDRNIAAIMLTTPCCVSGDHPVLTLFAAILLPPPLRAGWDTALSARKYLVFTVRNYRVNGAVWKGFQ